MTPLFIRIFLITLCISQLISCGNNSGSTTEPNSTPANVTQDKTPNAFSFSSQNNVALDAWIESNTVTINGINTAVSISLTNGEYKINDQAFTNQTGSINNGDKLTVRLHSASNNNVTSNTQVTVGDFTTQFQITTAAESAVNLNFNLNVMHQVGEHNQFERQKYITIHSSNTDNDWYSVGENQLDDLALHFMQDYDVYFGRDTGSMAWQLGLLPESNNQPGYVSSAIASQNGGNVRWQFSQDNSHRAQIQRQLEPRATAMIVAAQQHPYWPDGTLTKQGWAFSQTDNQTTPFGTATGDYMGQFIAKYFNKGDGVDPYGQTKPKFVEVMNEPLYDLVDDAQNPTTPEKVFQFHNAVANAIRNTKVDDSFPNKNTLIGGYTAAFPDFEKNNFNRWQQRDKAFIDIAGNNMDFISIHLYDFPNFGGKVQYRKGSNLEATLDLLESYTANKFGQPKPLVISEYGSQLHDLYHTPWSSYRDWLQLKAINSMLLSFMERPNLILKTIPFIPVKAEWGRESATIPYYWRLMRQQKEGDNEQGDLWVYTDLVKFYQLWAKVNGTRVESASDDPDLQIDSYIENNKAYLIINSLELKKTKVKLNIFGVASNNINQVDIQQLHLQGENVALDSQILTELPDYVELDSEATAIVTITFDNNIAINETAKETRYYSPLPVTNISAEQVISTRFSSVKVPVYGEAILKLAIARQHGLSLQPRVLINGIEVSVPHDYRGYDQAYNGKGREQFYGTIDIPVPIYLLTATTEIQISFAESGGQVASAVLQVLDSSTELARQQ